MKYAKIAILLAVLSIIGYKIYDAVPDDNKAVSSTEMPNNDGNISDDINAFDNILSISQCIQKYKDVKYNIDHTQFDDDNAVNASTQESLNNTLFATYINRFTSLCNGYLINNDWSNEDMSSIYTECQELISSPLVESDADINTQLQSIRDAIELRGSMLSFLNSVNGISISCNDINDDFPNYSNVASEAASNLSNLNSSNLFSNCVTLKSELEDVPSVLCNKHVMFLTNMISISSHTNFNYTNHRDFSENVVEPVREKINELADYDFYNQNSESISSYIQNLEAKIDKISNQAYIDL
jgi:hypothetical protein